MFNEIYDEVRDHYFNLHQKHLKSKRAKNNYRTKEGLERAIFLGYEDGLNRIEEYNKNEENQTLTPEEIRNIIFECVKRSTYFYINEPLLYKCVRSFDNLNLSEEERVSAATKGFVVAMNTFDETLGNAFSTYAYPLMSNEIIAVNKQHRKQSVIKFKENNVLTSQKIQILRIDKSYGHRIIRLNKDVMNLYDITYKIPGQSSEYTENYLYRLNPKVKEGVCLDKGEFLGIKAGAEVDIDSVENLIINSDRADLVFTNPLKSKTEDFIRPDYKQDREVINNMFNQVVLNNLNKVEQIILKERILPGKNDKMSWKDLSSLLKISQPDLKLAENRILNKIKNGLIERGFQTKDLDRFE